MLRDASLDRTCGKIDPQKTFKRIVCAPQLDLNILNHNPSRKTAICSVMSGVAMPQCIQISPRVALSVTANGSLGHMRRMRHNQTALVLSAL